MYRNEVALSYNDTCLKLSDVELLKGPMWLSDKIISFYFEYLEKDVYKDEEEFLFVSPEVTQCIKIVSDEEVGVFLDPLKANEKSFIYFPLNDNEYADMPGGSHWSLLVFSRPERAFYHFDSSRSANADIARKMFSILKRALRVPYADIRTGDCLQQSNGYDCGIHVLCTAEQVTRHIMRTSRIDGVKSVRFDQVATKRNELLNLIIDLGGRTQ